MSDARGQANQPDDLTQLLAAGASRSTLRITTRGRKTGKRHSVPIWFVVDGPRIVFGTLNPERDWVRNAKRDPQVELEIGDLRLTGRFSVVTEPRRTSEIGRLIAGKYWLAWLASWFGFASREMFEVDSLTRI